MNITNFNFHNQQVRTISQSGEPWFIAKDVAAILGYRDAYTAIRGLDADEKDTHIVCTLGGNQNMAIINESGLYSLILNSRVSQAKTFKKWVTSEVLPSIRKNGGYIANQEKMNEQDILANAVLVAQKVIETKSQQLELAQQQLQEAQPKILFANAVSASKSSILVGELAKILKQNGVDIGANRLFSWLRDNGYLIKRFGSDYNTPTQKSMNLKLFELKETAITHSDGHVSISKTTKVTPKGQEYFINKFLQPIAA
ncbi:phage antirepressor [Francisella philomiragia]|uniref:phage antirepressor n=1 Tax=Francisella philomiragia TaxID=28110 RepID=UPI001C9D91E7|nr:phage antirepressor KilAC domain-containing protein [Francisella philomiragia]MBY7733467.1 phage antirepressor KilAC domain-containing protein [Francisella philomiragia]